MQIRIHGDNMVMTISLILFILMTAFLIFLILFPKKWAFIVEKENRYWVAKGVFKDTTAEKFIRFEKSPLFKILVMMGMVGFLMMGWMSNK